MTKEQKQERLKEIAKRFDAIVSNLRDMYAGDDAVDEAADELYCIMHRITEVTTLVGTRKVDWHKVVLDHIFNLYDQ